MFGCTCRGLHTVANHPQPKALDYLIVGDNGWRHVRSEVPPICLDGDCDFPYSKRPLSWDVIELSPVVRDDGTLIWTRNSLRRPFFEGIRGWTMHLDNPRGYTAPIDAALQIHRGQALGAT